MDRYLYESLDEIQLHIDKTECLEKGIVVFPSIYIEGNAASGKTTAVKMFLRKHPEVKKVLVDLGRGPVTELSERLDEISGQMESEAVWVVFENVNHRLEKKQALLLKTFVETMPPEGRAIFVGRECPSIELLDLVWKRKMELISQEAFLFSKYEIGEYLLAHQSGLKAANVWKNTGGWPGCVDMMVRLEKKCQGDSDTLMEEYEIQSYVNQVILGSMKEEEKELIRIGQTCPWISELLCQELWEIEQSGSNLKALVRKGIFRYNREKDRYTLQPLFHHAKKQESRQQFVLLASWYEKNGYLKESFACIKKTKDTELYKKFACRYFDKLPFLDESYDDVMKWKEKKPEICYLRGMHAYEEQYFDGLHSEMNKVCKYETASEEENHRKREIYLNLAFVDPDYSFSKWMELLEEETKKGEKFRLYSMLGGGHSFLCGLRDVSGLFSCSKKEENRQAKIWKNAFHEREILAYRIARMEHYLETKRGDNLTEEEWKYFYQMIENTPESIVKERFPETLWRFRLAGLKLMCRWPKEAGGDSSLEFVHRMEKILLGEGADLCRRNTEAVLSIYAPKFGEPERLSKWLRATEEEAKIQITEKNYLEMFARVQGYLFLNHYEKAERILNRILPYLQKYHRYRYFGEALFCMSIVNLNKGNSGQAVRYAVESFLVTGANRYIGFYAAYGRKGKEVLDIYVEWMKQSTQEGWHRKKKYNYGNVLRMPLEDYLEFVQRSAKKETKALPEGTKGNLPEHLTMMETIILQSIAKGLNNAQICEEQNLKLPTVKTHIYSLYKKLNVNSRVQAVNKGKEMGIVG